MKKVEISTVTAITLLGFIREYIPEEETRQDLQHISRCLDDLYNGLSKMPHSEIESAIEDIRIAALIGDSPPMKN